MYGCDLLEDGSTRGFYQEAYDGRDFIALDEDMTGFIAADAVAQITKRKWEDEDEAKRWKHYLQNDCIEWLKKYMSYGQKVLERKGEGETGTPGTGQRGCVCQPSAAPPPQSRPRSECRGRRPMGS